MSEVVAAKQAEESWRIAWLRRSPASAIVVSSSLFRSMASRLCGASAKAALTCIAADWRSLLCRDARAFSSALA